MTIVTFKPKGGGKGGQPPHIDADSYRLLVETLIGFLELCIHEGDSGRPNADLERLTQQLQRIAERFTRTPKGAA